MSLAPQELENSASKYAAEAIRLDSEGSNGHAISAYQRAVEALVKLVQIYPDYKLNKIYMERANSYKNRIKALQMSNSLYDSEINKRGQFDQKSVNSTNSILNNIHTSKKRNEPNGGFSLDFEELLMTDKPKVTWNEVIGLDDAKRADEGIHSLSDYKTRSTATGLGKGNSVVWTSWLWKDFTCSSSGSRN